MAPLGVWDPVIRLYKNLFMRADPHGKGEHRYGIVWKHADPHLKYRFDIVTSEGDVGTHELGRGAFGVTYLAEEISTGVLSAVKVIRKQAPGFNANLFEQEVDCLTAVHDHMNIVTLYEVYETEQYYFMFMEPCRGGELFHVIVSLAQFSERTAAGILRAMLEGLGHMHARGIMHRDLKPENFLLKCVGRCGQPELAPANLRTADFGLAARIPRGTRLKELVGSAYYIAPEVLEGDYSYEADVWSIGAVAYVLLCGCPPFTGKTEKEVFRQVLSAPLQFPAEVWSGVSELAKDFVARLLVRGVEKRMTVAEALQHPWLSQESADLPLSPALLARLHAFTKQSRLQALMMTMIAKHVAPEQVVDLQKAFTSMDEDGDGELTAAELAAALRKLGLDGASHTGRRLLEALDTDGTGSVNYQEFLAAAMDRRLTLTDQAIAQLFSYLDTNGDGYITVHELNEGLKRCGISMSLDSLKQLLRSEGAAFSSSPTELPRPASVAINLQDFFKMLKGEMEEGGLDLAALEGALACMRQRMTLTQRLRQLGLLVVTRQLEEGEVEGLRPLFHHFDTDHSGTISLTELYHGLKMVDDGLTTEDVSALVAFMDVDGDHSIDFHEFAMGFMEEGQLVTEAKMRLAFDFFDTDHNGRIDIREVQRALQDLNILPVEGPDYFSKCSCQNLDYKEFRRILLNAEGSEEPRRRSRESGDPASPETDARLLHTPSARRRRNAQQVLRAASSIISPPPASLTDAHPSSTSASLPSAEVPKGPGTGLSTPPSVPPGAGEKQDPARVAGGRPAGRVPEDPLERGPPETAVDLASGMGPTQGKEAPGQRADDGARESGSEAGARGRYVEGDASTLRVTAVEVPASAFLLEREGSGQEASMPKDESLHNALKLAVDDLWCHSTSTSSFTRRSAESGLEKALAAMEAVWVESCVLAAKEGHSPHRSPPPGRHRTHNSRT